MIWQKYAKLTYRPIQLLKSPIRLYSMSPIDDKKGTAHSHSHDSAHETSSHDDSHSHESHSHSHESHSHSHESHSLLGHSHTHKHHNELLSASLSNPAVRITWIGLIVNIGLAASKAVGGVYFHSQSLLADAVHSLSDMVADFLTLATVNVGSKIGSADKFPLGYGKIESVGSLLVSGVLLFAGISVGWTSLLSVFEYTLPAYMVEYALKIQFGHSHLHHDHSDVPHGHSHSTGLVPDINAAWLAGGSIVVKELLFQKTMKIAEQTNLKVLVANAWHHRVDSMTALVAVITVTGGVYFNVAWLDSVGGLLVSVLIIRAGWGSFAAAANDLIDRGEPKTSEDSAKAQGIVSASLPEEFKVASISILPSGASANVLLTVVTTEKKDIDELNAVESTIIESLTQEKYFKNILVNFKKVDAEKFKLLELNSAA